MDKFKGFLRKPLIQEGLSSMAESGKSYNDDIECRPGAPHIVNFRASAITVS
ncbi:MAG TPA: hypothetical protein VKB85_04925 [Propionibacteriaceae bacterium]|nr:hypothetical protein [Propionibacteriaceae bacterium]